MYIYIQTIHILAYVYIYFHIYIYRERENHVYVYIYIYIGGCLTVWLPDHLCASLSGYIAWLPAGSGACLLVADARGVTEALPPFPPDAWLVECIIDRLYTNSFAN